MYALLILCAFLIGNTQNKINKDIAAHNETKTAAPKTKNKPLPAVPGDTPRNQPNTPSNSDQHNTNPDNRINRIEVVPQADWWFKCYVIATFFIAGANIAVLVTIWRQKIVMSGQLNVMQQQVHNAAEQVIAAQCTNNRISHQIRLMQAANEQTNKLIEQATASADAAAQNIELYINKERARLRVDIKSLALPAKPDPIYTVDFTVSIHGTTTAFITESSCVVYIFPWEVIDEPELGSAVMLPIHPLPKAIPANSPPLDCYAFLSFHSAADSAKEQFLISEIKARRLFVGIRGFIKYKDVFDRKRLTAFRYVWKYNEAMYGLGGDYGDWIENGSAEENRET